MSGLTDSFKEKFMDDKTEYDSLSQAIRLAKFNGADEKSIQPMITLKQTMKTVCADNSAKILKGMTLSKNMFHLKDNWYAIRYLNEKDDAVLKIDIINEKDVPLLQRDGRHERELSRNDLDMLLPGCIDEISLEIHKQYIGARAREIVYDHLKIEVAEEVSEDRPTTVSSHAGRRWVQRVLGIGANNESVADEYRRKNMVDIGQAVLDGYGRAELMWQGEDGITYWFDGNNIMYVVGNNNIITLYEEDFGFTRVINRMITLEQAEVLRQAHEHMQDCERKHVNDTKGIEDELQGISDKVKVLEAEIELLIAKKGTLTATREQSSKQLRVVRDTFNAEFNKLFKKWDV